MATRVKVKRDLYAVPRHAQSLKASLLANQPASCGAYAQDMAHTRKIWRIRARYGALSVCYSVPMHTTVYQHCAQAVRDLTKEGRAFTDLDVVQRASQNDWEPKDYKLALLRSNQIVQASYRDGKLVRYGLVRLPEGNEDYARYSARIVHASPSGPAFLDTPNGNFPRLLAINDKIGAAGRRRGTNRDDSVRWPTADSQSDLERKLNDALRRISELENRERRIAKVLGE